MKHFLTKWFVMTLAVIITAYILPGIIISGPMAAIVAALILGIVNSFVRPILFILTLPLTFASFGLFLFILNAMLLKLVSTLVDGFFIIGFGWALVGSVFISLVGAILNSMIKKSE